MYTSLILIDWWPHLCQPLVFSSLMAANADAILGPEEKTTMIMGVSPLISQNVLSCDGEMASRLLGG